MSNVSIVGVGKELKVILNDCLGDNFVVLDRPKYNRLKDFGQSKRDEVFIGLSHLIMDSYYFNVVTKYYLRDFYISKSDVAREIVRLGLSTPAPTVYSRIRLDLQRFLNDFGNKWFVDLAENSRANLDKYLVKIDEVLASLNDDECELDKLQAFKVPFGVEYDGTCEIEDESFNEFLELLKPYTNAYIELVKEKMDRKSAGYARYLLTNGASNEKEEKDLEKLKVLFDKDLIVI